jgi:hypothetical protein
VTATDVVVEREPEAVTAGAHWAGSAAEVAAEVGVVITVLPGAAEVTAVAGPLIAALAPRATWNRHAAPSPIPPVRVAAERRTSVPQCIAPTSTAALSPHRAFDRGCRSGLRKPEAKACQCRRGGPREP